MKHLTTILLTSFAAAPFVAPPFVAPPFVGQALAATPAALVEAISPALPGVTDMQYLSPGTKVTLPAGTTLVLDYLSSCVRETIAGRPPAGGQVQIGTDQSDVAGSNVRRERSDCDGKGLLQLAASESDVGGAAVWRGLPGEALPPPDVTLASTAPFIVAPTGGPVRIDLLSGTAPPIDGALTALPGTARASLDLASLHVALKPGALYRVTAGTRSRIFRVTASAGGSEAPLVARLLPL